VLGAHPAALRRIARARARCFTTLTTPARSRAAASPRVVIPQVKAERSPAGDVETMVAFTVKRTREANHDPLTAQERATPPPPDRTPV
jgi:hypothetical protein